MFVQFDVFIEGCVLAPFVKHTKGLLKCLAETKQDLKQHLNIA